MPPLRTVAASRYVLPLREGGSLPALVEADDDGIYVLKLRGAGQGILALVAELIVGELARTVGLRVPELVVAELDRELAAAEPDPEIQELLEASVGANAGSDFLPGALPYSESTTGDLDSQLAAEVVWLDALTLNVDRTPRNPNLLVWHQQVWLIDHGAAIYPHHSERWPTGASQTPMQQISDHVLLPHAGSIIDAHARLAALVDSANLERIVSLVPPEWLELAGTSPADYTTFFSERLSAAAFADEAEQAREGAAIHG